MNKESRIINQAVTNMSAKIGQLEAEKAILQIEIEDLNKEIEELKQNEGE